jgi:dTMP kinase
MLISFEGIEGSGKTTQIDLLKDRIKNELGVTPFLVREPGGTKEAELIRSILLDPNTKLSPLSEALLFLASRIEVLNRVILPRLKKNELVFCDRFIDSTIAYQGFGHGIDCFILDQLQSKLIDVEPDRTYFLDIPVDMGLHRIQTRVLKSRFDLLDKDFHQKVRRGFLFCEKKYKKRFVRCDATKTPGDLCDFIFNDLKKIIKVNYVST